MQFAPTLKHEQGPWPRPGDCPAQKIIPDLLHLIRIQQPTERPRGDMLRREDRFDLRSKFLTHPMLEGQGETALGTMHNLVRQRATQRLDQQASWACR